LALKVTVYVVAGASILVQWAYRVKSLFTGLLKLNLDPPDADVNQPSRLYPLLEAVGSLA
jgi:hypothetical protein